MAGTGLSNYQRSGDPPMMSRAKIWLIQHRLMNLVVVLLAATYSFIRVMPGDPILYRAVGNAFAPNEQVADDKIYAPLRVHDPPLGSVQPLPRLAADGADLSQNAHPRGMSHRAILMIMMGDCTKCAAPVLHLADETTRAYPELSAVAVSPSSMPMVREFRATNHLQLAMVSDANGKLGRSYNAVWRPRAYLLSNTGRLLWCQPGARPEWKHAVELAIGGKNR
jgi:AhpC/TSA family